MLQPKVYIKSLDIVLPVEIINFHERTVEVYFNDDADYVQFDFDEVEFMENTSYVDINKKHICVGDIVEILGVYFEIKYRTFKGYVIENEEHILSLEANLDSVSVVGNIYENKELLKNE